MKRLAIFVFLLFVLAAIPVMAQDAVQLPASGETLVITWPPPVTEVWGTGDVLGTVNVPNMVYYYLEYKQLNDDLSEPENAPWIPATSAFVVSVTDGPLATLDTTTVADGLYSLRLTVNTVDQQSFHYVVTPIRVNNVRFTAVEARIRGESAADGGIVTQLPEQVPPPADNTARVTPSGAASNIRRCDLVDNDRCPVVAYLSPNEFATVIGRNISNTWYQVRLDSGAIGWVAQIVIVPSGDFNSVAVANPPAPLPPPPPQAVASAAPTGLAIDGNRAVCNQQFNVQINVGNVGNAASSAGTITLQDVNVRTGEVTFTSYGNYPSITPNGNFVVVIPVSTGVYYNEQHELRAFTSGRQFTLRYTLEQGACNSASVPSQLPGNSQRTFGADECRLVLTRGGELSATLGGQVTFVAPPSTYPAVQVQVAGGIAWYQINFADSLSWIPGPNVANYDGNCSP